MGEHDGCSDPRVQRRFLDETVAIDAAGGGRLVEERFEPSGGPGISRNMHHPFADEVANKGRKSLGRA